MKIKLSELIGEEQSFEWESTVQWVEHALKENAEEDALEADLFTADGPIHVRTWVYRSEDEVFFRANLDGSIQGTCVRCLEPVKLPLEAEFGGIFCPKREQKFDEPEDPSHYFYAGEEIDFDEAIREHIFLNLPMNPTCETANQECQGDALRQQYVDTAGFEKEEDTPKIDARWDALRQIKDSMASKK